MKATFTDRTEKFTVSHRKENRFTKQYTAIAINNGNAYDVVTLRLYSTDSRTYAAVWAASNCCWDESIDIWKRGTGYAGGYGYHRGSAAAQEAIHNAGIDLDRDINGRGDQAIEEAVFAIARAVWSDERISIYITVAHA